MKLFLTVAITVFVLLMSSKGLQAQDTLSRAAWIDKVYDLMYAKVDLTPDETIWVKTFLDKSCDCTAIEEGPLAKECGLELFKNEGLPADAAGFQNMTAEQTRKFTLISPIFSATGGKCPDK